MPHIPKHYPPCLVSHDKLSIAFIYITLFELKKKISLCRDYNQRHQWLLWCLDKNLLTTHLYGQWKVTVDTTVINVSNTHTIHIAFCSLILFYMYVLTSGWNFDTASIGFRRSIPSCQVYLYCVGDWRKQGRQRV